MRYDRKCILVFTQAGVILVSFLINLKFSPNIFEKYSNTKFHENQPVGTELCHAEGQTDMTKLTVAIRNFAKPPKDGEKKRILMGITTSPLPELISKASRQGCATQC